MNNYSNTELEHAPKHDATFARAVIDAALASGWTVSVNDGEEWTVKRSDNAQAIWAALASTEADELKFRKAGEYLGSVWFIYGNGPGETAADYTVGEGKCSDPEAWQGFMRIIETTSDRMQR